MEKIVMRPMGFWESFGFFTVPTLLLYIATHIAVPALSQASNLPMEFPGSFVEEHSSFYRFLLLLLCSTGSKSTWSDIIIHTLINGSGFLRVASGIVE